MPFGVSGAFSEVFSLLGRDGAQRIELKTPNELIESDEDPRPPVRVWPSEPGDAGGSSDED